MASVEKYTASSVSYELRHNTREDSHPSSNKEIDPERTHMNYHLDNHGETAREARDYYNARMRELSCYDRKDINTICQWVCTAPKDLPKEQEEAFFRETYSYLNSLYGEKNCIQAVVHKDEGVKDREGNVVEGQAHLHYVFIPVVENQKFDPVEKAVYFEKVKEYETLKTEAKKHQEAFNCKEPVRKVSTYEEKVCADQVIRRRTLQEFHPNYQKWMDERGLDAKVYTGVTKGNNRTVKELKEQTKDQLLVKERQLNIELNKKLEKERSIDGGKDNWGREYSVDVWGREREDITWKR